MAGVHAEKVTNAHGFEIGTRIGRSIVRKKFKYGIVEGKFSFRNRETNSSGGETLAERKKHVRRFTLIGSPPPFSNDMAVPENHEAVERVDIFIGSVNEGEDGGTGDALRFGGAARERGGRSEV